MGAWGEGEATIPLVRALLLAAFVIGPVSAALSGDSAVILQYHHFGEATPAATSVTPDRFEDHLEYLEENGFTVWPVEKIVSRLRRGEDLPEKCVGLTVDDAYLSVYDEAFPMLRERKWPFTVFVPTEATDRGYRGSMTWDQMRQMKAEGVTFASHGHSHDHLVARRPGEGEAEWAGRVRGDVVRSLERLETELGEPVSGLFAYPYGEYDGALRKIVVDLGLVAFGQQSGGLWKGSDFGALPRFPMAAGFADMDRFPEKVHSLPLPVVYAEPDDPLLPPGETRPELTLRLAPGDYRRDSFSCYTGSGKKLSVLWPDAGEPLVVVTSGEDLPRGRSRYNCTAKHVKKNRYFWYSHPWIRGIQD